VPKASRNKMESRTVVEVGKAAMSFPESLAQNAANGIGIF
jgi:hypothetical protein